MTIFLTVTLQLTIYLGVCGEFSFRSHSKKITNDSLTHCFFRFPFSLITAVCSSPIAVEKAMQFVHIFSIVNTLAKKTKSMSIELRSFMI